MEQYFWLFPIIFIFHDMEEIIGLRFWLDKNSMTLVEKYPKLAAQYCDFSTEGFALAVFEELIICILLCLLAVIIANPAVCCLWLGAFIGCTFHFIVHIVQTCILRKYIPATITSMICLPVSIWIIYRSLQSIACMWDEIIWMIVGFAIVYINLIFATKLMGWFTRKMKWIAGQST